MWHPECVFGPIKWITVVSRAESRFSPLPGLPNRVRRPYQTALSGERRASVKFNFFRLPERRWANSMRFPDWTALITATTKAAPCPNSDIKSSWSNDHCAREHRTRFYSDIRYQMLFRTYSLIIRFLHDSRRRQFNCNNLLSFIKIF